MKKKNCFKSSFIRTCAFLITLLVLHPLNLFAEQGQGDIDRILKVKDGKISITAPDPGAMKILQSAKLVDVLKEIEAETGVKMKISNELVGKRLGASFADETIESALRQLLRGHYYVMHYVQDLGNKEKKVLKEVNVKDNVIGKILLKGKLVSIEIPYGSGKGELGAFDKGEGFRSWPSEYTVDDNGIVYILDSVNKRIQAYSSTGVLLPSIPLKTSAAYINIDKQGLLYIYVPGDRKIYQYNKAGEILNTIAVDAEHRLQYNTGPFHIINNRLYLDSCDYGNRCGKFLIGKITADNSLVGPTVKEFENPIEKYTFQSGKIYKGKKHIPGFNSELEIIEKEGMSFRTLSTPSENILTSTLIGEDAEGNFYFETVTAENKYNLYNIDKFGTEGEYIGTAQIPGGDVAARFRITGNGNIYNFIPEEKKAAKLFIFIIEGI